MDWNGLVVTVTGGAGFLGSHLVDRLTELGARVRVLDNLSAANATRNGHAEFIRVDVLDADQVAAAVRGSDVVFHLAAISNPRACNANPGLAFDVNVAGTKRVLEAARGARRVVFLSSAAVYGDPVRLPIDESHPLNGQDVYALSKLAAEQVCRMYARAGLPVTIIRNFNTFGPRQSPEFLIPQVITQAVQTGRVEIWNREPVRDYLYVDNLVDALRAVVESEATVGEVLNVGSGVGTRTGDLAERLSLLLGVPFTCLDKPVTGSRELVADTQKLRRLAGWQPIVPFEVGLERTVAYYRQLAAHR